MTRYGTSTVPGDQAGIASGIGADSASAASCRTGVIQYVVPHVPPLLRSFPILIVKHHEQQDVEVRNSKSPDRKTLSPSRHWTRFPSFPESARTAALSPFHNVRAVAHEFKFECPFEVPHALFFDRERGGQLQSCRYQRRLFRARRPDPLRPSRLPVTLAISTKASSHFILPTIPDIKPLYRQFKTTRKQEKDSDRFGSVTGEEDRKVTYETGELCFFSRLSFADGRSARAEPARSMLFPSLPSSKKLVRTPGIPGA
ncbi:hypothetical protein L1887_59392 [Cichorium endivia]|nr:hypothetical protein L1887_59392 [Cichorium endivia]